MRLVVLGAMGIALFSTSAGAAKFTMQLNAGPQQISRMQRGVAAVDDSTLASSVRLIQAEGDVRKRSEIQLLVMNQGDKPFNFGPENVTAKLADGTPIAIITYEQLVHEEKRRQMWMAIAAGLSAAGNSMAAANSGYYSGTAAYSGSTFGSFGSTPYSANTFGTATYSGYNAAQAQAAQAAANAQNQANFDRMAQQNASNMRAIRAYMRTTTVDPGQMFGGAITFELPKPAQQAKADVPMTFVVTINGDEHRFDVLLKRR
jgi:hypothetical protein